VGDSYDSTKFDLVNFVPESALTYGMNHGAIWLGAQCVHAYIQGTR